MGVKSLSPDEARDWISSHSIGNPSKFTKAALRLGPGAIPAMLDILALGSTEDQSKAGLVLSINGATVDSQGDSSRNFTYVVTLPGGERRIVRPSMASDSDFDSTCHPVQTLDPVLDPKGFRKLFLQYGAVFLLACGLAFGASQASGIMQVVLAALAGLFFAVALWSTLFMSVIELVQKRAEKFNGDSRHQ
jgi:hypothetical protein